METMPERWNGPFDEGRVFNFLVRMREGATVQLYRTYRGVSVEEAELLGWFKKESGARFLAETPGLGRRFSGERVGEYARWPESSWRWPQSTCCTMRSGPDRGIRLR